MTKKHSTKKALIASILSLALCFSMLIGTTFAWFTDSVTSANNIIKSGTLDVELYYADGTKAVPADDSADWKNADDVAIYTADQLWEPGYTDAKHIKISNEGTLALKYQLAIVPTGEVSELAEVIDVYYIEDATQIATRDDLANYAPIGTLDALINNGIKKGNLSANTDYTATLVLKMQENAGNEYQDLTIGDNFTIQLLATQYTEESDSFDNYYDAGAPWLGGVDTTWYNTTDTEFVLYTPEQLAGVAAIVEGTATAKDDFKGKTIKLGSNIDLNNCAWTAIGSWENCFYGSFDGQGYTVYNLNVNNDGWAGLFGHIGRGADRDLVVKNVTVKGATISSNRMAGVIVGQIYGNVENCHVENATITVVPNWTGSAYDNGDKVGGVVGWLGDNGHNAYIRDCSATNVTLTAYRDVGGITGYIGTTAIVEDCAVDTISIIVDQITNSYGSKTINAGEVVGRIYNTPVTVQNNTINNVTIAENLATAVSDVDGLKAALANGGDIVLLNDVTVTDYLTMNKSCTLYLNGKTLYMSTTNDSYISNGANVTIKNGTVDISGANFDERNGIFNFGGNVAGGNTMTIENVEFYGDGFNSYSVFWIAKSADGQAPNTLNLVDSKFELKNLAEIGGFIKHPSSGENCSAINITNTEIDIENGARLFLYGVYNIKDSEINFVDTTGDANGLRQGQFTIDNSKITITGGDKGISPRYADTVIKNGSVVTINNTKGNDVIFEYDYDVVVDSSSTFTYGTTSGTAGGQVVTE